MVTIPRPRGDAPVLDEVWVRSQFPALELEHGSRPVVYFDNPAGTQVPRRVIEGIARHLREANANTHGAFLTSRRTDAVVARARSLMAAFLGAASPAEIAFGPNMTTLTYSLSRALGRLLEPGDEVVVSDLDHDANVSPWRCLAERGVVIRSIPVRVEDCTLDLDAYERLLGPRTRLVAIGHASNAVGTINDVARISELAHASGAWVWLDSVHYAPHAPIDVQALGVDFLVCSAYKFFGPHLGVFWGRSALLDRLSSEQVRPAPQAPPERFETGTKNHEGLAGLCEALHYIAELGGADGEQLAVPQSALRVGMQAIRRHELGLAALLLEGLASVPGLRSYGLSSASELERRAPTFAFTLAGLTPAEVARGLAERGIFAWAGNHYAITLMERLGLEESGGVVRVGAAHYNTKQDVLRLIEALDALRPRTSVQVPG